MNFARRRLGPAAARLLTLAWLAPSWVGMVARASRAPFPAPAQALVIDFDAGSAPTMYAGQGNEAAGVYPALVRAAFASIGQPVLLRARPFKRMLSELSSGEAAAGAVVRTPERLAVADYSADYFEEKVQVFQRADASWGFEHLPDLRGRRVGVIRGWSYGAAFDQARARQEFLVEEVENDPQNFSELANGRLDCVLATEMAGRVYLDRPEFAVLRARAKPLVVIGIALAVAKSQGQTALLRRFDAAMAALHKSRAVEPLIEAEIQRARKTMP